METATTLLDLPCTGHHVQYRLTEIAQLRINSRGFLGLRTSPLKLRLHITVEPFNQYAGIGTDGAIVYYDPSPDPFRPSEEVESVFVASIFRRSNLIYPHVSDMLYRLGMEEEDEQGSMVEEIYCAGIEMLNHPSNIGQNAVRLCVTVRRTRIHIVDERVLMAWALDDSVMDFGETGNNGMIPTDMSAMETMLENVKVLRNKSQQEADSQVDESCTICLEELSEGSIASKMPCSHVFHPDCIRKWLGQSHRCPLCRFEMPPLLDK